MTPRCATHPTESATACFSCYLSQPCDDCSQTATHNGRSRVDGRRGQFCNAHTSWDHPAFARND